jgi:hypothetical protein
MDPKKIIEKRLFVFRISTAFAVDILSFTVVAAAILTLFYYTNNGLNLFPFLIDFNIA